MREVGVLEAKTNLSALLDEVQQTGEPVLITRHGKPVAQLSAPPKAERAPADLADQMRAFQSGVEDRLGTMFEFDWKEAVEDGRE